MTPDFVAMLSALSAEHVEFMLVGAHALAAHGFVRGNTRKLQPGMCFSDEPGIYIYGEIGRLHLHRGVGC